MQTTILKITGMTCGGCVNAVTKTLKAVPGVSDVFVSLDKAQANIQYDELTTELNAMAALAIIGLNTIPNHGYSAPAAMGTPIRL